MSQALRKAVANAAAAQDPAKLITSETDSSPTQAIRTIPAPEAQSIRHAHLAVLLGLFAIRFRALVADPISTMQTALPVVFALQAGYTITCLPAAGAREYKKPRPGEKKKVGAEGAGANLAVVCFMLPVSTLQYLDYLDRIPCWEVIMANG